LNWATTSPSATMAVAGRRALKDLPELPVRDSLRSVPEGASDKPY